MRLIVGISGASGPIYGIRTLEALREAGVETHLVISPGARQTIALETDWSLPEVEALASFVHKASDQAAPISSGSFLTDGMIVVPCSVKTVAAIAHSYSDNLLVRAADVVLKERRRLVVVPREAPLHVGHLRSLVQLAEMGAVILPPMPAFYFHPQTLDDVINHTVGKILDQFGVQHQLFRRWAGPAKANVAHRYPD